MPERASAPAGENNDIDLGYVEERPPLIPEGVYEVGFTRASNRFWAFGHENVFLYFKITTPGPYENLELYLPMRVSPRKGCTAMATSSKFARAVAVALGHPASRRDRLSTAVFKGKRFKAAVKIVDKDAKRRELPEVNHYSVIDVLLEKTAGA